MDSFTHKIESFEEIPGTMFEHLKTLGCTDEQKMMMAHQTLLELREVERLQNLTCDYNSDLDIIYITEQVQDSMNIYVPVRSSFILTPSWIRIIQDTLSKTIPKSIVLVIREGDSTFVRYKLTAGLIPSKVDCKKNSLVDTNSRTIDEIETKRRKLEERGEMSPKSRRS